MLKKINIHRLTALLLSLAVVSAILIATPPMAEAKSKKKEPVVTFQNTAGEWQKADSGAWNFLKPDGAIAQDEWVTYNGFWYYFKASGSMAENEWVTDGNSRYFIRPDGTMAEDRWIQHDGSWYRVKASGKMAANEWLQDGGTWYWLKADGKMASSEKLPIEGKNHNFSATGAWIGADLTPEQLRAAEYAAELLRVLNTERENRGLNPLSGDIALFNQAATVRLNETLAFLREHERAVKAGERGDGSYGMYYESYYKDMNFGYRPDGRMTYTVYHDLGIYGYYTELRWCYPFYDDRAQASPTPSEVIAEWGGPGTSYTFNNAEHTHMGASVVIDSDGRIFILCNFFILDGEW